MDAIKGLFAIQKREQVEFPCQEAVQNRGADPGGRSRRNIAAKTRLGGESILAPGMKTPSRRQGTLKGTLYG